MEVSSNSMKVARVTVRAMTQGLMAGRDFGLAAALVFGLGGFPGGLLESSLVGSAVTSSSSVKTAWLAKERPPFPVSAYRYGLKTASVYR